MCGIVGWLAPLNSDPVALDAAMRRMTATLVHRGPDDQGHWTDARSGIALGFRRLSILDLTETGHQPMLSGDGRYACVFNGEIYNHRDVRAELERGGVQFRGRSDTEVVVEAVAAFGVQATLDKLWGMFALAIWDRMEHNLFLARDRLGQKPLYVARIGGAGWLFASELKAFCAMDGFGRDLDPSAVAAYLRFGFVPAPLTIFQNAWKLAPGTFCRLRFGQPVQSETYWSLRQVASQGKRRQRTEPAGHLVSELDELLRDAVSRRMVADVPVGVFLSGGIDSATIAALMQAQSGRPVNTFSIGFHEKKYDEAVAAETVARHLGTDSPATVRLCRAGVQRNSGPGRRIRRAVCGLDADRDAPGLAPGPRVRYRRTVGRRWGRGLCRVQALCGDTHAVGRLFCRTAAAATPGRHVAHLRSQRLVGCRLYARRAGPSGMGAEPTAR